MAQTDFELRGSPSVRSLLMLMAIIGLFVGCADQNSGSNGGNILLSGPENCNGDTCTDGYVLYQNLDAVSEWSCDDSAIGVSTCYCANSETQRIGIDAQDSFPITNGVAVDGPVTMTVPSLTAQTFEVSRITLESKTCTPSAGGSVSYQLQ